MSKIPQTELYHHGIKGQHWGKRNGPPYPLGSDVSTGKKLKNTSNNKSDGSINTKYLKRAAIAIGVAAGVSLAAYGGYKLYNKLGPTYLDKTLKNKKLYTLSVDVINNNDRLYASFKNSDNNLYMRKYANSLFEKKDYGNKSDNVYQIVNKTNKMKIASIKNTENLFKDTYNNDASFKKSVDDWFNSSELKSRISTEWRRNVLYQNAKKGDLSSTYELFNKLGYTNNGNEHADKVQSIFKKVLNKNGYTAIYDLNDIRGDYKANSPIIVTNPEGLIKQTTNKIYNTDIDIAKKKYINTTNAETIYKAVSTSLLGTSTAAYAGTSIYDKKSKNDN